MAEGSVTVNLTLANVPNSSRIPIQVDLGDSPAIFKEKAAKATKIPLDSIRLIFRGRLIGKEETNKNVIEDFMLEDGSVIHCMGKPVEEKPTVASQNVATGGSRVTMSGVAQESTEESGDSTKTLADALATLRSGLTAGNYLTAVTTLDKVLSNIINNPMEEKYRKVKRGNAAFNKRLGGLPGGEAAMLAVSFSIDTSDGDECYILHPTPTAWPKLMEHKTEVEQAVQSAKNASASAASPAAAGVGSNASGVPGSATSGMGMPGMEMPAGMPQMTPQMQQAAAQMMRNPQQLQAMLQNPMVQNMLRNNPRFANSPMRQQIEQMVNNPQMLQQVSQMMQNPDLMNAMMNMSGGMGGNMPGMGDMPGMGGMPSQSQQGVGNGSEGTDQEMTEEEMIQEAIRRSLNENNENQE